MTIAIFDHAPKPPASLYHAATITAAVELSKRIWLSPGMSPASNGGPLKRTEDRAAGLLRILTTWREKAEQAGRTIARIVIAFEAGRDGFWLARWLRRNGIEAFVIHPSSIPVPRGARAKTDRLDTGMLLRAFSAWLRGEPDACRMVAIPSLEQEDLRRPSRERAELVTERTRLRNRIRALLTLHGLNEVNPHTPATRRKLAQLQTAEGEPLPCNARTELERLFERLDLVKKQIKAIEADYARHTPGGIRARANATLRLSPEVVSATRDNYRYRAVTAATLVAEPDSAVPLPRRRKDLVKEQKHFGFLPTAAFFAVPRGRKSDIGRLAKGVNPCRRENVMAFSSFASTISAKAVVSLLRARSATSASMALPSPLPSDR